MPGAVIWEGPSPLDGKPVVALATKGSTNEKTGKVCQVYILRADVPPIEAVSNGADVSVCGHCPMRGDGFVERSCYVNIAYGPKLVWDAWKRGKYALTENQVMEGRVIRWGAYGDPAIVPEAVVRRCNTLSSGHLGYTHQWMRPFAQWSKGVFMASVETESQERVLRARGWGTFRVGKKDGSDIGSAKLCANSITGITCVECMECDGHGAAIYIAAHGSGQKYVPAERLNRRNKHG